MATFANAVKDIIDSFDGSQRELESVRELLEVLEELAESKAELFANEITIAHNNAGLGTDKNLKVESSGDVFRTTHAYSAKRLEPDIIKNVEKTINDLLGTISGGGDWSKIAEKGIKIVIGLVGDALKLFLKNEKSELLANSESDLTFENSTVRPLEGPVYI